MKLFMKNFYDQPNKLQEIKDPKEYKQICLSCAGKLGGKIHDGRAPTWHNDRCECCSEIKVVTQPRDFIWRQ